MDANHHVADGYNADILLRWGDAIFPDSFDPTKQTAAAQERQFGYNNDYVGFILLEGSVTHGLLVVDHEYTNPHPMFSACAAYLPAFLRRSISLAMGPRSFLRRFSST